MTDEYPEMVTFFDGEIISDKHPFLTRKWDADEDVDKKHWVGSACVVGNNSFHGHLLSEQIPCFLPICQEF